MPGGRADSDPFKSDHSAQDIERVRAMLQQAREHKETIDKFSPEFSKFEGCSFPAHCRDLKWNKNGTLIIPLEVGFRFISLANPMVYSPGVPLAVHVERYSPTRFKGVTDGD